MPTIILHWKLLIPYYILDNMNISPETKLKNIPRITPKYAKTLEKMDIFNVHDLLFHFPFRYDDFSKICSIAELANGQIATVQGTIAEIKSVRTWKKKMYITEAKVEDETGGIKVVWFNQPYISDTVSEGKKIRLSGKVSADKSGLYFGSPVWELESRTPTNTGCLVPVYPETEGLTSRWLRWQIQNILKLKIKVEDPIPEEILKKLNLPEIEKALQNIHFPNSKNEYLVAQKRFAFEEMFLVQLKSIQVRSNWQKEKSAKIKFDEKLIKNFVSALPFQLTNAQRKASFEILKDMEKPRPMNRLLNGDVGSGKTIVAGIASLQAMNAGYQVSIMAPTEVLALQHYNNFCKLFKDDFNIALLTNSYKMFSSCHSALDAKSKFPINSSVDSRFRGNDKGRKNILENLKSGKINLIIGTHSLIQKDIKFKNLALIIVDEQHRFGVAQRAYLQQNIEELINTDQTQTTTEDYSNKLLYEDLTYKIRGAIFEVKKQLGLGHKENIYQKALEEELKKIKLSFKKEKSINIKYNNRNIGTYRPDFIIENKIILELKSLPSIGKVEKKQIWHYLKESEYKLALLANFGKNDIQIERIIYTKNNLNEKNYDPQESALSPHQSALIPHFLTMTATPIPRTLALAFFGNLDLSVLDEMPKDRKKIITEIIGPLERKIKYNFIREEIKKGRQCFVILPLVEDSKVLTEIKAAVSEHKRLSTKVFPDLKVGLVHGKLKSQEKEKAMKEFKEKKLDILVATAVVEVGIDVPNATVMIIEDADRFGLSQLHQFRGRIGRGEHQSYCFLFASSDSGMAKKRLKALADNSDGFAIAEKDLELRGPGQFFGTRQSGIPDIAMENLTNIKLIQIAREEAQNVLVSDPELKKHLLLKDTLKKFDEKVHLE